MELKQDNENDEFPEILSYETASDKSCQAELDSKNYAVVGDARTALEAEAYEALMHAIDLGE